MIVYNQTKEKTTIEGKDYVFYYGEDTLPIAQSDLLIVADGVGGNASPHIDMDRRVFLRERMYSLVFGSIFDEEDEDLKQYAEECFRELFETKDYYFTQMKAVKRSGYFASRFLSTIVAYAFRHDPVLRDREKLFSVARTDADELQRTYGDRLAAIVLEKMTRLADLFWFEVDRRGPKGLLLFPSTLSVTILNERKKDVEAVCLWAGDSRCLCWDEEEGMAILTKDHAGKTTSIDNFVSLSAPFSFETKYYVVKKPCVFFNISDGCYDQASEFAVEYRLLRALASSEGYEEARQRLEDMYASGANVDDSNTMALWAFGFDRYKDLKKAATKRYRAMEGALKGLPEGAEEKNFGQVEIDYQGEREGVLKSHGIRKWITMDEVKAHVADMLVAKEDYQPYLDARDKALAALPAHADEERVAQAKKQAALSVAVRHFRLKASDCSKDVWEHRDEVLPKEERADVEAELAAIDERYADARKTARIWSAVETIYRKSYQRMIESE